MIERVGIDARHTVIWHVYPLGFVGAEPTCVADEAPHHRLPRLVDKDRRADASVARILWAPSGDYAVVLSRQVLPAPFAFASDYVDIWRYDPDELPF